MSLVSVKSGPSGLQFGVRGDICSDRRRRRCSDPNCLAARGFSHVDLRESNPSRRQRCFCRETKDRLLESIDG
jgi:hypothetical protein